MVNNRKRRSRRGANRARRVPNVQLQPPSVPQQNVPRSTRRRRNRRQTASLSQRMALTRLSEPGLAFLKCAFAPPDFNTDPGKGIPDRFEGKVLSRKDVLNQTLSFTANRDTFIMITPTPGVAYFVADVPVGTFPVSTTTFTAVPYPGFSSLFGVTPQSRADQVSAFRYASLNVGLYPTSNLMQFAGSVTVWKCPIKMSTVQYTSVAPLPIGIPLLGHNLVGLAGVQAVGQDNYSETFIKGCFSQSVCNEPDFDFSQILEGVQVLPPAAVPAGTSYGQEFTLDAGAAAVAAINGWGNMDTIIIRVSSPTGAVNSAILKAWACIEYRPNPNALTYQFAHDSPSLDEVALTEYRTIARALPVAVPAAQNAGMWERVKSLLKSSLSFASMMPGPIGIAASGLSGLSELFSGFGI